MTDIKAVLFDIGGTLEHLEHDTQTIDEGCRKIWLFLKENRVEMDPETLKDSVKSGFQQYEKRRSESQREAEHRQIWLSFVFDKAVVDRKKIGELSTGLTEIYESECYRREARKEAKEALERLRKMNLKLGCVSNTMSRIVADNLKKYGLADYFDAVVTSHEFGLRKPRREIFEHALSLLGVEAKESVFVGDSLDKDIVGAKDTGFKLAVLIRTPEKGDKVTSSGINPDFIISDLREVAEILGSRKL